MLTNTAGALWVELGDLAALVRVTTTAAQERLERRLHRIRDEVEASLKKARPGADPLTLGSDRGSSALADVLQDLESLTLRPERGRLKDLRRIERFLARVERALKIKSHHGAR